MTLWVALRYEQCDLFVLGYCCKYSMKFIKEKVNKTFKLLFYSEKKWYFSCLLEQYHHYSVLLLFIIVITLIALYAPTVVSHILKSMSCYCSYSVINQAKTWKDRTSATDLAQTCFTSTGLNYKIHATFNHLRKITACTLCKAKWATQDIDQRSDAHLNTRCFQFKTKLNS